MLTLFNVHDIQFIDSPKLRNKAMAGTSRSSRSAVSSRRTVLPKAKSIAHDIVVVREANKKGTMEIDPDLRRLQVCIRELNDFYVFVCVCQFVDFTDKCGFPRNSRVFLRAFHNFYLLCEEQSIHQSAVISILQSVYMKSI